MIWEELIINKTIKNNKSSAIKIKSVEASSVYMLENDYKFLNFKTREYTQAHLSLGDANIGECLFARYARDNGALVDKKNKSYDFITMKFEYEVPEDCSDPDNIKPGVSKEDLRRYFYQNGATIVWYKYNKAGEPIPGSEKEMTYRMLVRSPGKAKSGECIFATTRDNFHKKMLDYLTMRLWDKIPLEENAKIVELSAYAPLIMGTAIDYIHIPVKNIFVLKDESVFVKKKACVVRKGTIEKKKMKKDFQAFDEIINEQGYTFYRKKQRMNPEFTYIDRGKTIKEVLEEYGIDMRDCPLVETGEVEYSKGCVVDREDSKEIENILWDGMGLIDESIFPEDKDGFIYCRSHFFKSCLFRGNIQQYFKDYYGEAYDTKVIRDYTGRDIKVSDIKVVVSEKSLKWEKFLSLIGKNDEDMKGGWKYFQKIMKKDNEQFAIVKTGHDSKYGNLQRMSYQMVNSLLTTDPETLRRITKTTSDLYYWMQINDDEFIDFLERTEPEHYSFRRVLVALYRYNKDFAFTDFYKDSKTKILCDLKKRFKQGKLLLEGDNLTLCSNVIAMLMAVTGQDFKTEDCFAPIEDGIQCYTERFQEGECLAGFRSPHNSPNNLIHLRNVYPEELRRYFPKLGKHVIVVNGIHTDIQARLNGADYDTDSIFTTNQPDVVEIARKAYLEFPTIVNDIPFAQNSQYKKDMESYAQMDISIADAQYLIGKSSNSAQLTLSYWHEGDRQSKELEDVVIILSVLAQLAIDSAKRCFDVDIQDEIKRINGLPCMKQKQRYPRFYADVQVEKNHYRDKRNQKKISDEDIRFYDCPMDIIYQILDDELFDKRKHKTPRIPILNFFAYTGKKFGENRDQAQKVKNKVLRYRDEINKLNPMYEAYEEERNILYDNLIEELRRTTINDKTMKALVLAALTDEKIKPIQKDLLLVLYDKEPDKFLKCFKKDQILCKK